MTTLSAAPPSDDARLWRAALWLAAGLTLLRTAAIFASPLELYPDEAQYWLWSRALAFGYASKPPLVALLIRLTTLPGDGEAWVRLAAPLLHAGAMLALYRAALRLYGAGTAVLASALYGLMPAVQVSALFIATDAPLMLCLSLSLWAYAALVQTEDAGRRRWIAAGLGAALGLGFLAKYAAIYFLMGLAIHVWLDRDARRAWADGAWVWASGGLILFLGPNLLWLAGHGFATVAHTAEVNAKLEASSLIHPGKFLEFALGQFGVLGPIPFAILIGGTVALWRRGRLAREDHLLLCFVLPPLVLVAIEAFLVRAHAHWAAAGYGAACVLVAAWLVRWRARGWTAAALTIQSAVAALMLLVFAMPSIADAAGQARRLQRHRGWAETAAIVTGAARQQTKGGALTAVAVEDRYLFNELAYYGRGYFAEPDAAPLKMRRAGPALNEAALSAPLTPLSGERALVAETVGTPARPALPEAFASIAPLGRWIVRLDPRHDRQVDLYLGVGYLGATSGLPTPS